MSADEIKRSEEERNRVATELALLRRFGEGNIGIKELEELCLAEPDPPSNKKG
jgi:hypothetical protein